MRARRSRCRGKAPPQAPRRARGATWRNVSRSSHPPPIPRTHSRSTPTTLPTRSAGWISRARSDTHPARWRTVTMCDRDAKPARDPRRPWPTRRWHWCPAASFSPAASGIPPRSPPRSAPVPPDQHSEAAPATRLSSTAAFPAKCILEHQVVVLITSLYIIIFIGVNRPFIFAQAVHSCYLM